MSDDELIARLRALDSEAWDPMAQPPLRLPEPERPPRRRLVLRPAVALACAAVLLVIGGAVGALLRGGGAEAPAGTSLALAPLEGAPRGARAEVSLPAGHRGGSVKLHVEGARPTPAGHFEELWFLGDDGRLVSVGTYVVGRDGRADVTFHTAADPYRYRFVDVSLEPADGDPGHSAQSTLRSDRIS